jgi:hypothetical protein
MADENHPTETAQAAPSAPAAGPPPLRAAMLVWPGTAHAQTWLFLWAGVAFVIGALLPWHGADSDTYVLQDGTRVEAARHRAGGGSGQVAVAAVTPKRMNIGAFLVLITGITMTIAGARSIWTRRLLMSPILTAWFTALMVVHFYRCPRVEAGNLDPVPVSGWAQLGESVQSILGSFGDIFSGVVPVEVSETVGRAGLGFYVTMLTTIFLFAFVLVSMFTGRQSPAEAKSGAKRPAARK